MSSSFEWIGEDDLPEPSALDGIGPYVTGQHPDRDNPCYRKVPLSKFFKALGICRNTAKDYFKRGVFPEHWLEISPGGKWFVYLESDWSPTRTDGDVGGRFVIAKRSLECWSIIRRRPEAAKSLPDSEAVEKLAFNVFSLKILGTPPSTDNFAELQRLYLSEEGQRTYSQILRALTESGGGSDACEQQARLLLYQKLIEFKLRFPSRDAPTSTELAELLHCSVASLYRQPFGKIALKTAKDFVARLWQEDSGSAVEPRSVEDLDQLIDRHGSPLTPEFVSKALNAPIESAIELLAEWEARESNPRSEDFEMHATRDIERMTATEEGYSLEDLTRGSDFDETDKELKQKEDRDRRRAEQPGLVVWEEEPRVGGIFLSIIPNRALGIVKEYELGKSARGPQSRFYYRNWKEHATTRKPSTRSYERAKALIDERKERLGCILRKNSRIVRRLFVGRADDKCFDRIEEAVANLLDELQPTFKHYRLASFPDCAALAREGTALWTSESPT